MCRTKYNNYFAHLWNKGKLLSRVTLFQLSITDVNVRKHLQKAEEKLNRDLQKEKAMYRDMFSSGLTSSSAGVTQMDS